jgi:preprotein translocase subunit SecD
MNRYPLWKNLLVVVLVLVGLFFALPNVCDQDPSIEISGTRRAQVDVTTESKVKQVMELAGISYKAIEAGNSKLLVRFSDSESQLKAQEKLSETLGDNYITALTLLPDLPGWMDTFGLEPMYLGLDLRGGVYVQIDVDIEDAVRQALERYQSDIRTTLRKEKLRYVTVKQQGNAVMAKFRDADVRDKALDVIDSQFRDLDVEPVDDAGAFFVQVSMGLVEQKEARKFALQQNITTLRNRVNALGIAEPIIQQQGERRIVVQLPGAKDPTKLMEILGATATLEYRLEDTEGNVQDALDGKVPVGSKLYRTRDGAPILLKKRVIVTGNQIADARSGFDQTSGSPAVVVQLDGAGGRRMRNVTNDNVGKPMAVVFIESRTKTKKVNGEIIKHKIKVEEVISVANILEPFGSRFQTTGLDSSGEAHDLALLLRAGALAVPIDIAEVRTIGPSLGQDNIDQGFRSVMIGLVLVMIFMVVYYRVFGLVANLALAMNLVLIVSILSLLQATLTLPGIAGIVLTVGMAVDANVLIFERIREEIGVGSTPQASIHAGYAKALSTIVDANITTLIAAVVLFSFGTGPIQGFAVTLFIGILTSLFTAIIGTRAVVNLIYGGRRVEKLSI